MDPQIFPTTSCPRTLVSCWYTDLGLKADERGTAKRQNRTAECRLQILQTAPLSDARCGCSIEPSCRTGNVLGLGNRRLLTTRFSHLRAAGDTHRRFFDTVSSPHSVTGRFHILDLPFHGEMRQSRNLSLPHLQSRETVPVA